MEPVNTNKPRKKRTGCLIPILLFLAVVVGAAVAINYAIENAEPGQTAQGGKTAIELFTDAGMSSSQATSLLDILAQSKFDDSSSAEHFSILEDGGDVYQIQTQNTTPFLAVFDVDGNLTKINVKQSDRQVYADGEVLQIYMTSEERAELRAVITLPVKETLTNPDSAKFPASSEWTFFKTPPYFGARSYVDAQNAFGGQVRNEFQVIFNNDGNPTSFVIGGEELIK